MGVLLISETKLKSYTNINKNVDMDVLKSEVQVAQDIDLQTILGSKFYHELLSKVSSTGNTFNKSGRTRFSLTYPFGSSKLYCSL